MVAFCSGLVLSNARTEASLAWSSGPNHASQGLLPVARTCGLLKTTDQGDVVGQTEGEARRRKSLRFPQGGGFCMITGQVG